MEQAIPADLAGAYAQCQKQAFGHYENFPVASILLDPKVRPHVAALYAFARTADDVADEPIPDPSEVQNGETPDEWRLRNLRQWEEGLETALLGGTAPPILRAFAHTLEVCRIPVRLPMDLLSAFKRDVTVHRYADWNGLLDYCRLSAEPVGRMVLLIHGVREEELHRYSDFLCTGLQLVNFWQDTSIDLRRGRIYYPQSEMDRVGASEKDLLEFRDSTQTRRLIRDAVDFTEGHFRQGYPLLHRTRGRLKLELNATYLGGQGILGKIRRMDYNLLGQRPAWTAADKAALALKALIGRVRA